MASKFSGFLDNVANGALTPKGNMADWQHASRLYVNDTQKHAPKVKFLYHVTFYLTESAKSIIPEVADYTNVIGMLVKSCDLPKFTAQVETKNKYNRKKHVQTKLDYQPINISFHDDNYGATTALLEAYYKYYFADGSHNLSNGAYGNRRTGDTTYDGSGTNSFKFGMDNNTPSVPFFDRIEIAQMARKSYTKFTLVNPIISDWNHDSLDNGGSDIMQNNITVQYDSVFYDRGHVEAGENGNPAGFGRTDHYDVTPSPLSPLGGANLTFDDQLNTALDLYEYITQGKHFSNPFAAGIAAANLFNAFRNNSSGSLQAFGSNLLLDTLGNVANIDVSGVAQTFFPKSSGSGTGLVLATAAIAGVKALTDSGSTSTTTGDTNPQQQNDAGFQNFLSQYQTNGGTGGINGARANYDALPTSEKAKFQ